MTDYFFNDEYVEYIYWRCAAQFGRCQDTVTTHLGTGQLPDFNHLRQGCIASDNVKNSYELLHLSIGWDACLNDWL